MEVIYATEESSLLAAIISNPLEDTPRTMYADFLDERGQEHDSAYAVYIRKSIELSTWKRNGMYRVNQDSDTFEFRPALTVGPSVREFYQRGIELRKELDQLWEAIRFRLNQFSIYSNRASQVGSGDGVSTPEMNTTFTVDRGFIDSIKCTAATFIQIAPQLLWYSGCKQLVNCKECVQLRSQTRDKTTVVRRRPKCEKCNGEGAIELDLPCPLTAHPVQSVEVTGRVDTQYTIYEWKDKLAKQYGIKTFITPREQRQRMVDVTLTYTALDQKIYQMEADENIKAGDPVTSNAHGRSIIARDNAKIHGYAIKDSYYITAENAAGAGTAVPQPAWDGNIPGDKDE